MKIHLLFNRPPSSYCTFTQIHQLQVPLFGLIVVAESGAAITFLGSRTYLLHFNWVRRSIICRAWTGRHEPSPVDIGYSTGRVEEALSLFQLKFSMIGDWINYPRKYASQSPHLNWEYILKNLMWTSDHHVTSVDICSFETDT